MTRPALVALAALALVACPSPEAARSAEAFGPFPSFESAADASIVANPCPAGTVPIAVGSDRNGYGAPYFLECPETCPGDPRRAGRAFLRAYFGRDAGDEIADAPTCPEARARTLRALAGLPTLADALAGVDVAEAFELCPEGPPYALASELSPGSYGAPYSVACPSEAESEGREP